MLIGLDSATELLVWGALIHLAVDWLGQSEWMAESKSDLSSPAGWIHAAMHGLGAAIIFPWPAALALAGAHLAIDTRWPLNQLRRLVSHPESGAMAVSVHIWRDQTLHLATIAAAALLTASLT